MNDLQVFDFEQQEIRVIEKDGELWFIAKDVSDILGFRSANDMTRMLDEDEKDTHNMRTLGGSQEMQAVNEPGLYSCIFKSRKQEAKKFKRWVTHEVLPAIRKTGSYQSTNVRIETHTEKELAFLKFVADDLKVNEASKIQMYKKLAKETGCLNVIKALPDYTEEPLTISLTELLKRSGMKISAVKANKILIDKGVIEVKERPSSKGGVKKFKAFTENGLQYGKNLINPQNQKETQPHFFDNVDVSKLIN